MIKKIEVINLKDNIVRLFLLHKHFDVNFETLRYNQNNYILSVKDKKYYLAERNVNIYRNEDLVYAILRGYKIFKVKIFHLDMFKIKLRFNFLNKTLN